MTVSTFEEACAQVQPVRQDVAAAARAHHDNQTKPRGALGRVEELGIRLCAAYGECPPPVPEPVTVAVFAADHGVVAEGVTPWPQEVTAQMVANFCAGGAAINVLARTVGARVVVVDVGVATPIPAPEGAYRNRVVACGTRNLAVEPAMTLDEVRAALDVGASVAGEAVADGARLLVTGDMGIGNTTAAAAVIAACCGRLAVDVAGRGTGVDDDALERKRSVIAASAARLSHDADALAILAEVGGLEIAALCGFIVGAAACGVPVVVDGVIAAAAALLAVRKVRDVGGYLIAGHRSSEPGSRIALDELGLAPILELDMRLGEGSGAVLAVPVIQAAASILRDMATFDAAGVTDKGDPRN